MNREKLLRLLGAMYGECVQQNWCNETEEEYQQIVALIKNQPTIMNLKNKSLGKLAEDLKISFSAAKIVSDHAQPEITKKDIECWATEAQIRVTADRHWGGVEDVMKEMLTEIGVSICPEKSTAVDKEEK